MSWLRRRFITGFFVTVPLIVSVAALVWGFGVVDGVTAPLYQRLLGRDVPGLGLLTGALAVLMVGVLAANVIGRRILQRLEHWLLLVPVFRTDLRARQTADRRLFARQRNRIQAGRARGRPGARAWSWAF